MMVCFKLVPDFLVLHKNEIRGRDTIVHSTLLFLSSTTYYCEFCHMCYYR